MLYDTVPRLPLHPLLRKAYLAFAMAISLCFSGISRHVYVTHPCVRGVRYPCDDRRRKLERRNALASRTITLRYAQRSDYGYVNRYPECGPILLIANADWAGTSEQVRR